MLRHDFALLVLIVLVLVSLLLFSFFTMLVWEVLDAAAADRVLEGPSIELTLLFWFESFSTLHFRLSWRLDLLKVDSRIYIFTIV